MASLVIGVAGAAVGAFFGGPAGAAIGWSLGSAAGGLLFPNKPAQVPHDLHIQGSSYGAFRKIIYGTVRISGNVIWETDLQEHDGGGKGKTPQQQTFTASFDVALCETKVVSVLRFWAAGRLNYDINQPKGQPIPFTFYDGNSAQLVDPTEEATEGVGNVPAYRGISRVVFADWDMTQFGNSIPQLSFELQTKAEVAALAIVKANYATGYNLVGFFRSEVILNWDDTSIVVSSITVSTARIVTTALQQAYDLTTFAATGTYVPPPSYTYPGYWDGPVPDLMGIGNYVFADDSVMPLWAIQGSAIHSSATNPPICTLFATSSGGATTDNVKFLHAAGVPDTGFLSGAALSTDGKQLFIFTAPTFGGTVDTWYKIVDGSVTAQGTVASGAAARLNVWGSAATPSGSPYINRVCSVENNGRYLWFFAPAPAFTVSLCSINGTVLDDWGGGTLNITDTAFHTSGFEVGIEVIRDGFCGLATGTCLVEVTRVGGPGVTYLDEVVADLCGRAGLDPTQYNVTQLANIAVDGYVIESQITCRAAIESLMPVYFFDAVESDGVVKFVLRGSAPIVTFAEDDLAAHMDSDNLPSILSCVHTPDTELPSAIDISYMNKEADYQINTQPWRRMSGGNGDVKTVQVPLVLTDDHAKKIVEAWGFNTVWERDTYTWYSSRKYAKYEPTDVVIVQGITIRITSKNEGATGVIKWEGVPSRAANYVQAGASGAAFSPSQVLQPTVATQLILLDIPMRQDSDNQNGLYAAMAGASAGSWPGGSLFKSSDGGSTYSSVATAVVPATIGTVTEALGNFPGGNTFDEANAVTVTIGAGGGTLASEPELAVLNGANRFLIGGEEVQAKNCVLTAPSTYRVSGFLRGRRGTEAEIPLHVAGETFVDLSTVVDVDAPFSDLGQARFYKAVTFGQSLATGSPVSFINYGAKLRPYSPAQLGGGCDASGNVTINAHRRTRVGGAWIDFSDVLLGESTEGYVLQIWSEHFHQVARIVTGLTSPTFTYTTSMITADFGAAQLNYSVSLAQVGSYMLGAQATAVIPGTGGSNNAPLSPVTPYNNPPPSTGAGCSGTVISDTLNWATPTYIYSPDGFGGPDQTWLLSFTTGSIVAGAGRVAVLGQLPMGGKLTTEPCGPPLPPTQAFLPSSGLLSFWFYMTGNPSPGSIPTLLPSTIYYVSITRPSVGPAMSAILISPNGS